MGAREPKEQERQVELCLYSKVGTGVLSLYIVPSALKHIVYKEDSEQLHRQ